MASFEIIANLQGILAALGGGSTGPKTSAASQSVTPASDAQFKMAPSAVFASASFTPIAGAYTANDVMGAVQEFVFYFADTGLIVPANSVVRLTTAILKIDQTALQTGEGAYQLQPYNVTPPSALTDNSAWTLSSADLSAWRAAPISLGTPVDQGSACVSRGDSIDKDFRLGAGSSLFSYLQTIGAITAPASPAVRQVGLLGYLP